MESLNINQKTLLWLSAAGISNNKISKLLDYFGSPQNLWDNFESEKYNLSFIARHGISKIKFNLYL